MSQPVFERAFIKRIQQLRTKLREHYPNVNWTEGLTADGTITFYLTEKILWNATQGVGTRELKLERPNCQHCGKPWIEHEPAGDKCLFGPTSYFHDV